MLTLNPVTLSLNFLNNWENSVNCIKETVILGELFE